MVNCEQQREVAEYQAAKRAEMERSKVSGEGLKGEANMAGWKSEVLA